MNSGKRSATVRRDYLREHLRQVPAFRALVRSVECRLFEQAFAKGGGEQPLLDVGCGDGLFASLAFAEPPFAGIDPNEASLREARGRQAHLHIVGASATAIPFPDGFFKTVAANCVVEHIADLEGTLAEISRVLSPGGRFLFGVPSHRFADMLFVPTVLRTLGLDKLARGYGNWFNAHSRHFHTYDPDTWRRHLATHGFAVEQSEYYLTPAAHRAFDVAHYLGIPRLVSRKLTGKWVAFPNPISDYLFEKWLRPHYDAVPDGEGPYLFFDTRKKVD